jgi:hypothetical protein
MRFQGWRMMINSYFQLTVNIGIYFALFDVNLEWQIMLPLWFPFELRWLFYFDNSEAYFVLKCCTYMIFTTVKILERLRLFTCTGVCSGTYTYTLVMISLEIITSNVYQNVVFLLVSKGMENDDDLHLILQNVPNNSSNI